MAESTPKPSDNKFEDLEIKIEKYPYAVSPLLIDEFYIFGFTDYLKYEEIIKPISTDVISRKNFKEFYYLRELKIRHLPSALSTVTSESNIIRIDIENLTDYAFPVPPKIFCYIENKDFQVKEPGVSNFLFSNCNNETIINGYSYGFYEKKIIEISKDEGNMIFYFPKFFITISQYNYYYACYKICKYIHEQFLKDNIEIPLEIQIYNIINFTPCPVNSNLELSLFALNGALNCKTVEEYKNLTYANKNNIINLDQLGAYRHSDINFGKIFEILYPDLLIRILFVILNGGGVAFFHEDLETLSYILYFFYQITFPITPKENIYAFSPNTYFFGAEQINYEDNITGFPCFYENIEQFHPYKNFIIYEKEQELVRKNETEITSVAITKLNYAIVDLKNGDIKFSEKGKKENGEPSYEEDEQIRVDIDNFLKALFKNADNPQDSQLYEIIIELYKTLENLSNLIKQQKCYNFFVENEDIKKYSLFVQEAFLRFIILFYNRYYKAYDKIKQSKKKKEGEGENDNLTDIERKIYKSFNATFYNNIVENIKDYYRETEPKFMKATKINFVNLMSIMMADEQNKMYFKGHLINLLNSIFYDKDNMKKESASCFEFIKYYNEKMKKNIFNLVNDEEIFDKTMLKKENEIIYYYKYNTINLSNDLLFKYNLYLSDLDEEIKDKIFPKKVNIMSTLSPKDINDSIDKYLFSNNLLNVKNVLQFCILDIVILSIPELKMMTFAEPIYNLFQRMNLQIRKYVELILNVSYRYFYNKNEIESKEELNEYFNIYKRAIEDKNLYTNDGIYLLKKKIDEFLKTKKEGFYLPTKSIISKISNTPEDVLYKLTPENLAMDNYEKKEGKFDQKISIKATLLDNEIASDFIYYPNTLYQKLNELVDKFYKTLDIEEDRDEYYKLVMNVIFYVRMLKDKFPYNIIHFLFYCLIKDNEPIKKEIIKDKGPSEVVDNGEAI